MKQKEKKGLRKQHILIIAVALIAVIIIGALLIPRILRARNLSKTVQQQNYVAAKLLEMGNYEEARTLAAKSEQMKENSVSKELLVLAMGFQSDFQTASDYAEKYLEEKDDEVLEEALALYEDFLTEETEWQEEYGEDSWDYEEKVSEEKENMQDSLLALLIDVQDNISVKIDSQTLQALMSVLTTEDVWSVTEEEISILENEDSQIAKQALLDYAVDTGDYEEACELAEEIYNDTRTSSSRSTLANVVAEWGIYLGENEEELAEYQEKTDELYEEIYELNEEYWEVDTEEEMEEIQTKIDLLQDEIEALETKLNEESVNRAINFVEVTTPVRERDTVGYKVELSQLYYQAGDTDKARDLLVEAIKNEDEATDAAADIMEELTEYYQEESNGVSEPGYVDYGVRELDVIWNRIVEMLGIIPDSSWYSEDAFYSFLLQVLDDVFNGIIIRSIDTTDFPTVRVTVNISTELEQTLKEKDFSVKDMGKSVDFSLLDEEDLEEETGDISISLVIDNSGSMGGSPIEETKKAVTSFVKNADSSVRLGVTRFDNTSEVLATVGSTRSAILNAISGLEGEGGTSIYLGLQTAAEDLASESGKKIIILLSDGEDGDTWMIEEVLAYLKAQNIIVYTIGFGSADSEYLSYIATSCGGKYLAATSEDALNEVYTSIGNYIENDYVLEFTAKTDLEDFSRYLEVGADVNDAYAEEEYDVGVPYEDIESEDTITPYADYFREIGGSATETDADEWE